VLGIGAALTAIAFLNGGDDPLRPYWPVAVVLGVSGLYGGLAVWTRRGEFVYASGLLVNVAGQLAWQVWAETAGGGEHVYYRLFLVHIICLALASLAWSAIELGGFTRPAQPPDGPKVVPFRHLALGAALGLLASAVGFPLFADAEAVLSVPRDVAVWFALAAFVAAAAATLWDGPEQRWAAPLPQLYFAGLLTLGSALHFAALTPEWLGWFTTVALAGYTLLTALACVLLLRNPKLAEILGMPPWPAGRPLGWLVHVQVIAGAVVACLSVWICLGFADFGPRLGGAAAVAFLTCAWVALSPHWRRLAAEWNPLWNPLSEDDRALVLDGRLPRFVALLLGVLSCACLSCAFVAPHDVAPWLHRTVLLLAALTLMSVLYGLLLPRVLPALDLWAHVARRLATPLGIAACVCLFLALVQEVALYDTVARKTPLAIYGVVVVTAALLVLAGGALTFALSPERDLFRLSERRRTLYVYAAEVLLVVTLAHVRLNVPYIIPALVARYWVFAVMAVAFLGVGLSELCRRRGLRVLSGPLERTAMFLPILPVAAFLVRPLWGFSAAEEPAGLHPLARLLHALPGDHRWHALIWFLMGLLYLVVSLTRRSSNLALLAAVAANFGLWVIFGHEDRLTFLAHPQLWLIPVGLIVLAAEQLNRDSLERRRGGRSQALALRYAGLLLIYLSSTADMFITGLGQSVQLPIVLALLSVAGVLLGILLRVRAFLFLGVTFLFLDVFSQIWHAAVDRSQTWVWWASGVVLGAAILTLFALFEKRRNEVLQLIDDLRHWR
jgi:hypothetical protein